MTNKEAIEIIAKYDVNGCGYCHQGGDEVPEAFNMAINALKEQKSLTLEPKRDDLSDTAKEWLDKMNAVDALNNIADICMDWDGYRTANGLGGLINEIWAYARYCADKLQKEQEPVKPVLLREGWNIQHNDYRCPICKNDLYYEQAFCDECGRAVKWE